ncbi:MAG TPA: carboxypeptidase regulatory-like domain-containing protein [Pyrinomonadaceae bacterium]|nr:carboxypeptidase regulatory-like domain-containing protein [Pyrinomonadaceae bacterium]
MRALLTIGVVILSVAAAFGQTNKGSISGTVSDTNGAQIPGAMVTITNLGTGQKVTVTTTESGAFTAQSLDPVTYSVAVEAKGFKKAVVEPIKVDTAAVATANVILEAGLVSEQVMITADAPLINADSGTTSQTITSRQIQDVPLNNRSVLDLALTAPNVTGDAGSEDPEVTSGQPVPGFNLNVNGGRAGSTSILADGVNNTGVGIARAVVSFTPETVQEFTVQTSAYSAEFGNTSGGVINATTKSGTNSFNGVALWYHRNPKFNARPFTIGTAPRPNNNLRYNQVSVTVGGPIILPRFGEGGDHFYNGKNKSFFFFAYEPRWRQDFVTSTGLVPDANQLAGNFNNLVRTSAGVVPASVATQFGLNSLGTTAATIYQQFVLFQGKLVPIQLASGNQYCQFNDPRRMLVNQTYQGVVLQTPQCNSTINANPNPALNIIPSEFIDPAGRALLGNMPPAGDYFLDSGNVRNFFLQRSVEQNETRYTLRLDHSFTDNAKVNFRYTKTPAVGVRSAGNDINGNAGIYSDAKQYLLAFNNIVTPTLVNDLRLNYTRANFSEDYSPEFAIKTGRSYAGELGLPHLTPGGIPLFLIARDNNYVNADIGSAASTNNFNIEQRYNISDIAYWTRGNKTWKFGVDLSDARLTSTPFFAASGGRWDFRVLNTSNNRTTGVANGGNTVASTLIGVPNSVDVRPLILDYDYRWKSFAGFVQNDWRVRPNLTLNLGLRYSLQLPREEKHNMQGVFRPDLAQSFPLTDAQRRLLASGTGAANNPGLGVPLAAAIPASVPTAVNVVPFAFAGRAGRSKYLVPIDYWGWEPRFGFAWNPKMKIFGIDTEERSLVVRGGYGISHATLTGNNRSPNPDFGGFVNLGTVPTGSASGATADPTQPIRLTGNAPVQGTSGTLDSLLGTDANGLVFFKSLGLPAFAVGGANPSGKVPYSQNWNLSIQFELFKNTVVEVAYVGNKATHLFLPFININPRNVSLIEQMEGTGLCPTCTLQVGTGLINDPLGRTNLQGTVIMVSRSSVFTPYLGFDPLNTYFDPSGNSIRHAGYIDIRRRINRGITFTANYTYGKSIDTASDASPDTRTLSTGQARQQVSLGGDLRQDRAISTFDIKNNFTATGIWDIPFGRGRRFLSDSNGIVNALAGGWVVSGIFRMPGGLPFLPFLTDPNKLGGVLFNRYVRPDIVPGVPLRNPLWKRDCPTGNAAPPSGCEPYINPAAFMRPVKGTLGNAPRTLDIRSPRQEFFDFSISKDIPWPFANKDGKRRINFRVDLINAFNHPNFRYFNTGNVPNGFGGFPTEITTEAVGGVNQPITAGEYNTWAAANGQPAATTPAGATLLAQIRGTVNATRQPGALGPQTGGLPLDFFHVPVPEGFATRNALSFDIRTLEGFKLYRIRQAYDSNFGTLTGNTSNTLPRYIQFGLRIFF